MTGGIVSWLMLVDSYTACCLKIPMKCKELRTKILAVYLFNNITLINIGSMTT